MPIIRSIAKCAKYVITCGHLPTQKRNLLVTRRSIKTSCKNQLPIIPFKLADIGEGIREVTIKNWFVQREQFVNQFDDVCEVESDKATVMITCRYDGTVKKLYYNVGDVALVGSPLLDIEIESVQESAVSENIQKHISDYVDDSSDQTIEDTKEYDEVTYVDDEEITKVCIEKDTSKLKSLATPAVRRIAMEHGVDINKILGTGKSGRVTKEDVLLYLTKPEKLKPKQQLTGYRKVMMKTMTESNQIPTLVLTDEFDISELHLLRQRLKFLSCKITLLPFIIKAVSLSLMEHPVLNSSFDKESSSIHFHEHHNIGIAVDTPYGLVVPNIKNVETLSIKKIVDEVIRLQTLANDEKLSIQDVSNATFTVSNIGSIAGTSVKPLILPPQVAIVGIGKVQSIPRFDHEGNLKKASIIHISWAADHRVVDGATVARFSNLVKQYLENPAFLLINV